jgi:hypothetical protein
MVPAANCIYSLGKILYHSTPFSQQYFWPGYMLGILCFFFRPRFKLLSPPPTSFVVSSSSSSSLAAAAAAATNAAWDSLLKERVVQSSFHRFSSALFLHGLHGHPFHQRATGASLRR